MSIFNDGMDIEIYSGRTWIGFVKTRRSGKGYTAIFIPDTVEFIRYKIDRDGNIIGKLKSSTRKRKKR